MTPELILAAENMLTAISGMYIEFVDRQEQVNEAENRLWAAVAQAKLENETK